MRAYIPKELYENVSNEKAVHEIVGRHFNSDVLMEPLEKEFEKCRSELRKLGETRIADSLKQLITIG